MLKTKRRLPAHAYVIAITVGFAGVASRGISAGQSFEGTNLYMEGSALAAPAAAKLERALKKRPGDIPARSKLLAYYAGRQYRDAAAPAVYRGHLLWLIRNRPEAPILENHGNLFPQQDPTGYEAAKNAWLKQTARHPKNPVVLGSAANFFVLPDKGIAERMFRGAEAADPRNPSWPDRLGHLFSLGLSDLTGNALKNAAMRSLTAYERALKKTSDPISRLSTLSKAAKVAVDAGELAKARKFAEEVVKTADLGFPVGIDGNAVHYGNMVLGRVSLREGDTRKAGEYLLASGRTPGSATLGSFGPNMLLAKELLKKGEIQVVLKYFELCKVFWPRDHLNGWSKDVKAGRIPDFGANVDY